jgi:hypothetical protein
MARQIIMVGVGVVAHNMEHPQPRIKVGWVDRVVVAMALVILWRGLPVPVVQMPHQTQVVGEVAEPQGTPATRPPVAKAAQALSLFGIKLRIIIWNILRQNLMNIIL